MTAVMLVYSHTDIWRPSNGRCGAVTAGILEQVTSALGERAATAFGSGVDVVAGARVTDLRSGDHRLFGDVVNEVQHHTGGVVVGSFELGEKLLQPEDSGVSNDHIPEAVELGEDKMRDGNLPKCVSRSVERSS
jgi:hypothetical protein